VSFLFAFVLPTTHCEEGCTHCFYETGHSSRVEAVDFLEPLDRALDLLLHQGLQQVVISGGEPLLSPRLEPLVKLCNDKLLHLLLLTRGGPLDRQMLAALERWGVDDITLSASADDEPLRRIVNRILFHSRYLPTLLTCITRENLDQVRPLMALADRLNLPQLFTPVYIPRDHPAHDELSLQRLDSGQWDRLLEDLRPWTEEAGTGAYWELVRDHFRGRPAHPGRCHMGSAGFVVDADGSVYPCFHRHDQRAGNLLTDPWPEIQRNLHALGEQLCRAPCFGEHCLSLFVG
jgi:MoaA/NifB/PqqE/SkfB family radical SAM enzyme